MVIVDRLVPRGPIVPHGDIAFPPPDTALEFGLSAMLIEHVEYGRRFLGRQTFDMRRENRVHE